MYIEKVAIENFGIIAYLEGTLEKEKINFVLGENGSGKTTFMSAIYSLLKKDSYICCNRESRRIGSVHLTLKLKDNRIEIVQKYQLGEQKIYISNMTNLQEQIKELQNSEVIAIMKWNIKDINEIDYNKVYNFIKNYKNVISNKKMLENILYRINNPKNNFRISGGEQNILKIMDILADIEEESIVICDDFVEGGSIETEKFILEIMHEMKNIQFIITKSIYTKKVIPNDWFKSIKITNKSYELNPVGSNVPKWIDYKIEHKDFLYNKENLYYKEDILEEEESKQLEYKEVKGNNPCTSIIQVAPIYVVAFLNTRKIKRGCIKWGITDDRVVKGVNLDKKQKDTIRKRICEELQGIKPHIGPDEYDIQFKNVFLKSGKLLENTYVIELTVNVDNTNEQRLLYATSKEEVYRKTEGGKIKLTAMEIQEEIIKWK